MSIRFNLLDTRYAADVVGFLPQFFDERDPQPARVQIDRNYAHGGGWRPFIGFELCEGRQIKYPGDPVYKPIAEAKLRDETIVLYPHSWVAIFQKDGTFEIAHVD